VAGRTSHGLQWLLLLWKLDELLLLPLLLSPGIRMH
jgi:hypothetical protein